VAASTLSGRAGVWRALDPGPGTLEAMPSRPLTRPTLAFAILLGVAGFAAAQGPDSGTLYLPPLPAEPAPRPAVDPKLARVQDPSRALPDALPARPPGTTPPPGNPSGATTPAAPNTGNTEATPGAESSGSGSSTTTVAAVNTPTTAEAAAAGPSQTNYLARFLGIQDAPVKVYGWIENSYTGNTNGRPRNDSNFIVFPNRLANAWQGNQYYLVFEKTLSLTSASSGSATTTAAAVNAPTAAESGSSTPTLVDYVNFGGRFDVLFGNDWEFTKSYGLFDRAFKPNSFPGVDLPQIFGEVHLPILTKNGFDIRGGRFYSPAGFENVQAVKRPLLSIPYLFNYTPFTLFGVLTTLHLNERTNIFNGAVNGWDRWIDRNYRYSYIGGFSYNTRDLKTTVTSIVLTGPDQLPRFAPANSPFLPTGVLTSVALQGKVDPYYAGNWRTYFSSVVTHTWNARLTEAAEVFFVHETNVPGLGPNGTVAKESGWYGAAHWFIYQLNDKFQGVWRSEIFRDNNGGATGSADNYYEITLGLPYKPKPWFWIRPEARYDWAQFHHPFNDGTRSSQLTLAFDVIFQF